MAKKALAKDQFVKLIVGAGQASPSPPVGPALGSKGVKSMDFCKVKKFTNVDAGLHVISNLRLVGVQRPNCKLRTRYTNPSLHHHPP